MMILTTLSAAAVATQPTPVLHPNGAPAPMAAEKWLCCEKIAKGEGCACCKGMAKEAHEAER